MPNRLDVDLNSQGRIAPTAANPWLIVIVFLAGLACGSPTAAQPLPRITHLPTLTPTPGTLADAAPSSVPGDSSQPVAVVNNSTSPVATPENAASASPGMVQNGWKFTALRQTPQANGLLLVGEVINHTGQPQTIKRLAGIFYNDRGQIIAGPDNVSDARPVDLVPPEGRLPFRLTVPGISSAANFELSVTAEPGRQAVRRDFQFVGLEPSIQAGDYCVTGQLQNPGSPLQNYLVIGLMLYDNQDNVINFSNYNELYFAGVSGNQLLDFEVCVPPPNQNVTRHEVRAWGW